MSEFGGTCPYWQYGYVPPKAECGCPEVAEETQKKKKKKKKKKIGSELQFSRHAW